jgi:serine/threonine-protein kinase
VLAGVTVGSSTSTVYALEVGNVWNSLRTVAVANVGGALVSPLAGGAGTGNANGAGSAATFGYPYSISFYGGTVYVCDMLNNSIRAVNVATREVTTWVGGGGTGTSGYADGTGTVALFNVPWRRRRHCGERFRCGHGK